MRLAALVLLAGCATISPHPDPDVALLQGCWSDGSGGATLRLMPNEGAGGELVGYLVFERDGRLDRTRYAFARDGSRLAVSALAEVYRRKPGDKYVGPAGEVSITFARENRKRGWRWSYTLNIAADELRISNVYTHAYESVPEVVADLKRADCGPDAGQY